MTHNELLLSINKVDSSINFVRHEHNFVKDLDGQVTCSICGAMDDERLG